MDAALETAQQSIASSSMPAAGFDALSPDQRRQVFFLLPESLRASLLADMDDDALQRFVRRLDPDEVADVLGVSMVLNLVIAGFFRTLIPLVLERVGKDPATSATIFITTATDVLGFFIFLGLAQSVL